MKAPDVRIKRVGLADLMTVTQMAHANMSGVDRYFTELVGSPLSRLASYFTLPLYFLLAGRGYKALVSGRMVGCAFLHLRQKSGFVFNVNVNRDHRRQGIGSLLMEHLEEVTRQSGRRWTALQVDGDNKPAREMYARLGYRPYHPDYLHVNGPVFQGEADLDDPGSSEAAVSPLIRRQGLVYFQRYRRIEIEAGDAWAAEPLREYAPELPGGRFWRCSVAGQEVGCAWQGKKKGQPLIRLNLVPEMWGDAAATGLVSLLVARNRGRSASLDVYLGSSAHHEVSAPLLIRQGFERREQMPMMMVKQV